MKSAAPPPALHLTSVPQESALDGDLDLFIKRPGKRCADREPECGDCAEDSRTGSDSRRINHRSQDLGESRGLNGKINQGVSFRLANGLQCFLPKATLLEDPASKNILYIYT